ncbi:unnamed protein product [Closterium sp. NIES-54]
MEELHCARDRARNKWADARALVTKSAATVAEAFEEIVLTRFRACGEVLADQGTEFQGELAELLASNGIQHRTTSRYHPQSDGLTERLVQTVKKGLRVYGKAHKGERDKKLGWVMAGYRSSKQAALKNVFPYYLLFEKQPILRVHALRLLTDSVVARMAEKWVALADAMAVYVKRMLLVAMEPEGGPAARHSSLQAEAAWEDARHVAECRRRTGGVCAAGEAGWPGRGGVSPTLECEGGEGFWGAGAGR